MPSIEYVDKDDKRVDDSRKHRPEKTCVRWIRSHSLLERLPCHRFERCRTLLWQWYTIVMLLLVAACLHADQNLAAPNLSAIAEDFGFSPFEKDNKLGGQVQLGFFVVGGATSLAMGPLADRMNRVNLLLVVVVFGSLPCALITYIPSGRAGFFWFFCSRILTGISVGGSFPLLYSLVGDLCAPEQRAMISAALQVATAIGVATGQLLAGFLGPKLGWRMPFVIVAYPAIAVAILLWITVSEPRRDLRTRKIEQHSEDTEIELSVATNRARTANNVSSSRNDAPKADHLVLVDSDTPTHSKRSGSDLAIQGDSTDGHEILTDCSRFKVVWRGRSNRFLLCQAIPSCVAWSTVTTFIPDYLHTNQGLCVESATLLVTTFGVGCLFWALGGASLGQYIYNHNKIYLAYIMTACTSFAVIPFLVMINSSPDSLQSRNLDPHGVATCATLPSVWACFLAVLAGTAAVTGPNMKGLLMNLNPSSTRGTVFALVTLTDDVGKGLGPEFVAIGVLLFGRRLALSVAMGCWWISAIFLYCTKWTIVKDVHRIERMERLPHDV